MKIKLLDFFKRVIVNKPVRYMRYREAKIQLLVQFKLQEFT